MLQLTQIYSTGPRHVVYAQPSDGDPETTTITMADGWTFRCRESPYFVSNHL